MIKIFERKKMNSSYYIVETWRNGKLIVSKTIKMKTYKGYVNDKLYYILYDSKNNIIQPVWEYINIDKAMLNESTKDTIISALKDLYCFAECFKLNLKSLSKKDALEYLDFLYGHSVISYDIELYLLTTREYSHLKAIISYSADFLLKSGFRKSANALKNVINGKSSTSHVSKNNVISTCDYINESQYNNILYQINHLDGLNDINKLKYKLIFILMYMYGMRIGEVLGITLEDIYDDTTLRGERVGRIILRNRISDSTERKAKTCFTPTDKSDYKRYSYEKNSLKSLTNAGFQIVTIAYEAYDLIQEYIAVAHTYFYSTNGYKKSIADCVEENTDFENHYLFLNDHVGSPLSYYRINKLAKDLMINAGVKPNPSRKRENWCHKCRHGFVIRKIYVDQMRAEDVIQLTRHRSVLGLQPYLRMSADDIAYYCEDFAKYRRSH